METDVTLTINLEKFRYSLVGDGYLLEEVTKMTDEELIAELEWRVTCHILGEYKRSIEFGYVSDEARKVCEGV